MDSTSQQSIIPIVDLGPLNLPCDLVTFDPIDDLNPEDPTVRALAEKVVKAFTDIGFLYITNHGISQQSINKVNETTGEFFGLPTNVKTKYQRVCADDLWGWRGLYEEQFDKSKLPDYKETFNATPFLMKPENWPSEVSGFKEAMLYLCESSIKLGHLILKLMGVGLQLKNPNYFIENHNIRTKPNTSTLRAAMYPPFPKDIEKAANVIRCGEHSDYGSITLVYQDNVKGLQVKNRGGQFIDATPVEGAVVINISDMMQRWTADRLISTKHRVVVPDHDFDSGLTRRSVIFFLMPDEEAVIRCIDNSDKYPPVKSGDYAIENLILEKPKQ